MKILDHEKKLILREHDVKNITLRKIRYGVMSIWDIELEADIYKHPYTTKTVKECNEKGYPILLNVHGVTRLLIFNRPL